MPGLVLGFHAFLNSEDADGWPRPNHDVEEAEHIHHNGLVAASSQRWVGASSRGVSTSCTRA